MSFISKNKLLFFVVLYLVVVLIAIPLTLVNLKKPQDSRSSAAASTVLSMTPSTAQKTTGDSFAVDIMINPGTNAVSFVTLDISYDQTKLELDQATGYQVYNPPPPAPALRTIIEGPVYDPGRVRVKVSVGNDPANTVRQPVKVGTVNFKAIGSTGGSATNITFGESTFVLSTAPEDNPYDNVLSTTQPAAITIGGNDLPTPTGGANPTNTPIATAVPSDGPTITIAPTDPANPTPTCTPLPDQCTEDSTDPACTNPPAGGYCTGEPTPTVGGPTPTTPPVACTKQEETDVIIVLDRSTSMEGEKATNAKSSAKNFVNLLANDPKNKVGLVTFSKDAQVVAPLTTDFASVNAAIDAITLSPSTCHRCGIDIADREFQANGRATAKKIMVFLTDGRANTGGPAGTDRRIGAEQATINQLKNAKTEGIVAYTIGIGTDVNQGFLNELATMSNGLYYYAAEPVQIDEKFTELYNNLSDAVCNGEPILNPTLFPSGIPAGAEDQGAFNNVTLIMILLMILPLILLFGHILF